MTKRNDNVKCAVYLDGTNHVKLINGNDKVGKGIYCVNLICGSGLLTKKDGTVLCNIPGTCGGCCDSCEHDCYGKRNQIFRSSKKNLETWANNTLLAVHETRKFFDEIQDFIDKNMVAAIRFHVFGEIPKYDYLVKMVELAKANPNITIYSYSKRFSWLERYIKENGMWPSNLHINVSIWHKNYENPCNLPEFIYDDGTEPELADLPHCPAVDKDGHETGITCAQCKWCLKSRIGEKMCVYAH